MYGVAVVALAAASGAMAQVTGTYPAVPLISKHFDSPADLPYKVDDDTHLVRGTQYGFNICNSTTENQQSNCQTFYFNGPNDFCITAPPEPGKLVADLEGEMVAWCSKPGYGTRLIPSGAITGLEFRKTPDYIQVVGFIDQTQVNMSKDDYGGEMDSGGADGRGNPMGGVFFSSAFGPLVNAPNWVNFIGGGQFALKVCDPSKPDRFHNCEHIYDRIGAAYNLPNAAKDGVFVQCDADNADFPGVYTSNGQVMTYTQPDEALGAITTMPYQPKVPASSNCKTLTSAQLFTGLPSGSASVTGSSTGKATGSSSSGPKATGSSSSTGSASPSKSTDSGANAIVISSAATVFGVIFAGLFLA